MTLKNEEVGVGTRPPGAVGARTSHIGLAGQADVPPGEAALPTRIGSAVPPPWAVGSLRTPVPKDLTRPAAPGKIWANVTDTKARRLDPTGAGPSFFYPTHRRS